MESLVKTISSSSEFARWSEDPHPRAWEWSEDSYLVQMWGHSVSSQPTSYLFLQTCFQNSTLILFWWRKMLNPVEPGKD